VDEALSGSRIRRPLMGKELQGDRPLEPGVLGFVDDPHPAASDLSKDAVFSGDEGAFGDSLGRVRVLGKTLRA